MVGFSTVILKIRWASDGRHELKTNMIEGAISIGKVCVLFVQDIEIGAPYLDSFFFLFVLWHLFLFNFINCGICCDLTNLLQ